MTADPPSTRRRRLAIVDDHGIFAGALQDWLPSHIDGVDVVYSGADPAAVPAGTDLVLLDIELGTGVPVEDVTRDLVEREIDVLLVSAIGQPARIRRAVVAGALGYVPKHTDTDELTEAIGAALAGEAYVSPDLAAALVAAVDRPDLSIQERTALQLYASGRTLQDVARSMNVEPTTAREYLLRVRRKYADVGRPVRTKTDLHVVAREDGILDEETD